MRIIETDVRRQPLRQTPSRCSRWAGLISWALFLSGCEGGSPRADGRAARADTLEALAAPASAVAGPSESELRLRHAMFEGLIDDIRASHVFSSVWPRTEWERDLPALWQEVSSSTDRPALWRALRHLSNSLRDGHLGFTPAGTDELQRRVRLPFQLVNTGSSAHPRFMISGSERVRGISPGDELLTYDGVPSAELLQHFRFELNAATPGARLDQLSNFLESRFAAEHVEGTVVALTLQHGAHVVPAEARFRASSSTKARVGSAGSCPTRARKYGGTYQFVEAGTGVCLYRATREPFASYPIVRHISFLSSAEERRSDHQRVEAFLAAIPRKAGVLLDLRDNGGGVAADYLLPWYAPSRHRGLNEWVRLNPKLTDRARLRRALRNDAAVDEYLRRSAGREDWWVRPFDCGTGGCEDSQPRRLERVTSAPVALLLGPGCRSACDSFAAIWSREGFGPTVGTPPAAMYTSLRYPLAVELGGELLGDFTIALCGLRWEATEPWLEGRPLPIDAPVESSGPSLDDDLELLDAAMAALRKWPRSGPGHAASH
jgi:hypothetical protein